MKENMKSRRGVALAEAVIALVVIGIISVATLTIIFSSIQVENKTIVAMDVRNQAENAIECFRFAKGDETTFIECLNKTTAGIGTGYDFNETGVDTYIYVLDKGGYSIKITLKTKNMEGRLVILADDRDSLDAFEFEAAYDNREDNNNNMIYRFSFPSNEGGSEQ